MFIFARPSRRARARRDVPADESHVTGRPAAPMPAMHRLQTAALGPALVLGLHLAAATARAETGAAEAGAQERPVPARRPPAMAARDDADEARLPASVSRDALVRLALRRSPALAAATARARAMRDDSDAEASLPAPMAEAQIWQIPFSEPYRLDRAGMTMVGLRQEFTPGGARSARARAARGEATVEEWMRARDAQMLAREVEHAFADYVEAHELVAMHRHHKTTAEQLGALARARFATGGALADVAQSDREVAMIAAELATNERRVELARARINGLLVRAPGAPLGPPSAETHERTRLEVDGLLRRASATRPEFQLARQKRQAARAMAEAESEAAKIPTLSVGAYYFPPSETMPMHGFGFSFSSTLPWLWGDARARRRAAHAREDAAALEQRATHAQVSLEVMTSAAEVAVRQSELDTLEHQALPAARRAEQATLAGYEAGRAEILSFLMARTAVVETEVNIVRARAALAHALTDLRWAIGSSATGTRPAPQGATHDR